MKYSLLLTSKFTHHPINKKPRLESIKLQSGYEPNLNIKKLYHDVGASFIPTVPPSVFRVEIGKVVEKADSFQQNHLHRLR
ncbi:MAG TPA: hypothetical protein QGH71_04605, partial [Candidatus Marinimicrobia bacterium]|nr:hypothetical protein [Candidatus Neomarinimicrobiota bacterium]